MKYVVTFSWSPFAVVIRVGILSGDSAIARALFQSLLDAPSLVSDLPEAVEFSRDRLRLPSGDQVLNFQQKLGHMYEDVFSEVVRASPGLELVARGHQIREAEPPRRTLGELDFVLREEETGVCLHVELAIKFYLAVESERGWTFPGPDARDNFAKKIQRMREHQLTLGSRFSSLIDLGQEVGPLVPQHLMLGCLFDHVDASRQETPRFASPGCRRGRWMTIGEFQRTALSEQGLFEIPKSLWPVPLAIMDTLELPLSPWRLQDFEDRCVLLRIEGEELPYFIAPNGYPDH